MPKWVKPVAFLLGLLPLVFLVVAAASNDLGPDPSERVMHITGEWALRFLILTLLMSPLRQWTGKSWPLKFRRMLGLYAFFYACIHLVSFGPVLPGLDCRSTD